MTESRVFVTHAAMRQTSKGAEPLYDYTPAARYGQLRYLATGRVDWSRELSFAEIDLALSEFRPSRDYLLLSGDVVAIAVAVSAVTDVARSIGDPVRLLVYDRENADYRVVALPVT